MLESAGAWPKKLAMSTCDQMFDTRIDELLTLWKEAAAWMTNFLKPFMHVN